MDLTSRAFHDGAAIPRRYTGDGENFSPPLAWTSPPPGTQSFALVCEDPDAPGGTWHHWAIFDIPAERRLLAEHVSRKDQADEFKQARNDFRKFGYDGPSPPPGHGPHRYQFRLIALSVDHLPLPAHPSCSAVASKAEEYALAEAELVGRYER